MFDCFYVKAANVNVYKKVISIDKTAPVVTLDVQKNKFTSFINKITFGLFFKETISVSIVSSDNLSGIAKTEYQIVENESDYDVNGTWGAGKFFKMSNKQKFIVYARVTDKAGNVTIVNSTGTVIYSESTAPTTAGTFDKKVGSEADVNLEFTLNGNTVNTVKHGNTMLTNGTDYTVNGNIVTVKKEYLKNFEAGTTQKFTVTFNPMGVITDKVDLSADCSINIIDTTHKHTPQHHSGTAATCTTAAVYYYDCTRCDKVSDQDTFDGSALGHDYSVKNADEAHLISAATCTSPAVYSCESSRCKDKSTTITFKNGDVIPHDFGEETETKSPAVGKNGEKSARCKNCGFTKITSIPALTLDFASNDAQLFSKGNDSKPVVELNNTVTESDIEVYVGKTQVPSGMFYLSNDGKTIVLKKKFLNTLEKGEYTLNVKSPSGKISKTFVVDAVSEDIENATKGSKNEQNGGGSQGISKSEVKSPKTAEDKNASLWILLLCTLSGEAAMVTVLRKRLTTDKHY